jgi:hypothetical protein
MRKKGEETMFRQRKQSKNLSSFVSIGEMETRSMILILCMKITCYKTISFGKILHM